ncbi:MAG: hypothetical protein ACW98D_06085, partial [Promethearchaeota archaeon]
MTTLNTKRKSDTLLNNSETIQGNLDYQYHDLYDYMENLKNKEERVLLSIVLPMYNEEKTI